jgi:hypothetical protein
VDRPEEIRRLGDVRKRQVEKERLAGLPLGSSSRMELS